MNGRARWLLLVVTALLLSSCAVNTRRTLVFWHTLTGARERALLDLVDQWNTDSSHAVVIVPQRSTSRAQHAALLDGAKPDIALVSPAQAESYTQIGMLRPLDDFAQGKYGFSATDYLDLYPFVFAAGRTSTGELIGLPLGGDVRLMLFDADWLAERQLEAPSDRQSLRRLCELSAATGACFAARLDAVLVQEWLQANGAPLLDLNQKPLLDSARSVALLSELVESTRNGVALAAVSDSQVSNEFASGRVVFAFEWTSSLREVDRFVTAGAGHKWGVAPIPSTDGAPASLLRAPLLVIPRTRDADETQAWLFVRWMLDTAQTARWAAATDEFPARLSAITMLDPARMPKNYTVALQHIGGAARVEPLLPSWTCVVDGLNQTALLLLNTQSITDTLTAGQLQMSEHLSAPCALR
jgi:ABC-type glycerol-3-phosphate transport system substrate-binding protein